MQNKRFLAFLVSLIFILSFGISLRAFKIGLTDVIDAAQNYDVNQVPTYNLSSWNGLTTEERRSALENIIISHGGTSSLRSDFVDSSEAYNVYNKLSGNGLNKLSPSAATTAKVGLESSGNADFGLGFYDYYYDGHTSGSYPDDGHTSGTYGDDTVADQLNDDFIDYSRDHPQTGSKPYTCWIVDDLYVKPVFIDDGNQYSYTLRVFYKDGSFIADLGGRCFYASDYPPDYVVPDYRRQDVDSAIISNFIITDYNTGSYSFDLDFDLIQQPVAANVYGLHWTLTGAADCFIRRQVTDTYDEDPTSIPAVGVDDNGNKIDITLSPNYVTYKGGDQENNQYSYNNDNSVTIGGTTYYIVVNPADVSENYYQDFIDNTVNRYSNHYTTDFKEFDDSGIIEALKSIFNSLESLRSNVYTYLKLILDNTGYTGVTNINPVVKKLNEILEYLKTIKFNVDQVADDQAQEFNTKWLELIGLVKDKFQVDQIQANVDNCVSALFADVTTDSSGTLIATYDYDPCDDSGEVCAQSGSFIPSITFSFLGSDYNLLSSISCFSPFMDPIKDIISAILIIQFILGLFRSLPSIIGGVSGLITDSPDVQVSLYRSKYDH